MAKQRINRRQAAYRQLNAAFPLAFPLEDAEIRPLAIAIRDELAAWDWMNGRRCNSAGRCSSIAVDGPINRWSPTAECESISRGSQWNR